MLERKPVLGLVEDDPVMGESLVDWFRVEGWKPVRWRNGREAIAGLGARQPDVLLCDIRLPDMTGEDVLSEVGALLGRAPVVFITGYGDIAQAVRLVQAGALDYITKPFDVEALIKRLNALVKARKGMSAGATLGEAPAIAQVERTLRRVAPLESTVLLRGPSGSGKEVAARFLHKLSPRAELPFLAVNCAALPRDLLESEVFGHERGAFTGAHARHEGFAERVGAGTLFLDEIAELPLDLQAKLLRLIEGRSFVRVGGDSQISFRARVVAATNADIEGRIAARAFREDLYFRLAVIPIDMPSLRERSEDIMPLAGRFIDEYASAFGRQVSGIAPLAEQALREHAWPGNIRELRNRVERAVALSEGSWLKAADFFPEQGAGRVVTLVPGVFSLADAREAAERRMIEIALTQSNGDVEQAATILRVSRSTMFAKIRKLGVRVPT